jgi:hypothetical protein
MGVDGSGIRDLVGSQIDEGPEAGEAGQVRPVTYRVFLPNGIEVPFAESPRTEIAATWNHQEMHLSIFSFPRTDRPSPDDVRRIGYFPKGGWIGIATNDTNRPLARPGFRPPERIV